MRLRKFGLLTLVGTLLLLRIEVPKAFQFLLVSQALLVSQVLLALLVILALMVSQVLVRALRVQVQILL